MFNVICEAFVFAQFIDSAATDSHLVFRVKSLCLCILKNFVSFI
ncbi:putative uncharacterized protein [Parachlamydia acanthamoebae UV-7]|jgi:hypothetical protein|uniref:Uncharacterized protein n=2 Tax=Parachlamydia acanthamoebae TaxID=83552 RepID=F8KZY0_PARAV|nr:hypothetical protein pah_c173o014 [Parachlamydia acanthamoebae str. Hall's coccus]KIA77788.1 hypothetical protein DB43_FS00290 [Parachlamydia acanthamoebae]CCB86489.1 putative uncharacterized protein [Parachlamydia acanthamoebae UV-7]